MIERSDSTSDFVVDTTLDTSALPIGEILVAQAGTSAPTINDATPPSAGTTPERVSLVVQVENGSVLHLPEGISIDAPRMNGANLEFVQPDGSVVVVPNGAIEGLTIVLGSVEIPPLTVAALFAASDIQTAAGPAGNGPQSSGGNFEVLPAGDIGSAFNYGGLLDGTDLPETQGSEEESFDNNFAPRFAFSINEIRLSEEGLEGGNPDSDGNSDTTNNAVYSGNLNASDPNGDPLSFRFDQPTTPVSSHGVELTWTGIGTSVLSGWAGDTLVVQASVSNGSGAFTVTLFQPVDHPANAGENELRFDLPITATDGRGGDASTVIRITVEDDSPSVDVAVKTGEGAPSLAISIDETVGSDGGPVLLRLSEDSEGYGSGDDVEGALGRVTTSFEGGLAALFSVSGGYGADGAGSITSAFSFTGIPVNGLATNLSATHGGLITLFLENGAILGKDTTGEAVFKLEIIGAPGAEQLQTTLLEAIAHSGESNDFDERAVLQLLGGGAAQLKLDVTRTDFDGDTTTNSATIDLISRDTTVISFEDDGPQLGAVEAQTLTEQTANGVSNDFTSTTLANVSLNVNWGSDGPNTQNLAFTTPEGNSGLTSNGETVSYTVVGTLLTAAAGDRDIFTVKLNSDGSYTFTLKDNIDHALGSNNQELTFGFKAIDGDGDFILGNFQVNVTDAAPTISTTETETVSEKDLPFFFDELSPDGAHSLVQPGKLNIDWNADDNNDGAIANRSVAFGELVAPADLTSDGKAVTYSYNTAHTVLTATAGGHTVFTVSLSDSSTGSYTFRLYGNIDHAVGTDTKALNFGFVATDADGDTASSSFTVNLLDDQLSIGGVGVRYVEEEALPHGNEDASPLGVEADGVIANLGSGVLGISNQIAASLNISWGNDDGNSAVNGGFSNGQVMGDRSVVFASGNPVNASGGVVSLTSHGQPLVYTLSANGTLLTASAGGHDVFSVTLSDQANGSYKFKLLGTLDHPIAASGANNEDVLSLRFNFTARDGDGDQGTGNFVVRVIDDSPVIGPVAQLNVNELTSDGTQNQFIEQTSKVSLNIHWGADGAKTDGLVFTNTSGTVSGLSSNGESIAYSVAGHMLTATAGGRQVFTVTLNNDGTYSFVLKDNIDHAPGSNDKLLSFGFQATDADNDTATGTFSVHIKDSVPILLAGTADTGLITEGALPQVSYTSGSLNVDINADDRNTHVEIAKDAQGHHILPQGLTSDGVALDYVVRTTNGVDQEIVAFKQGQSADNPVFVVAVVRPGNFVATLFQNLDHAPGGGTLAINLTARVYDGDGDYVDRAFTVNVADTVPVLVGQSDTGTLVEGHLPYISSTFGNLHVDLKADNRNTHVEIAKDANGNYILPQGLTSDGVTLDYLVRSANGVDQEIVAFKHGESADKPVLVVSVLHPGSFAATLYQNLDHAAGSDTLAINLIARVYDGDGDYVDRAFTVNVADDAPTLTDLKSQVNLLTNGDFAHGDWAGAGWGGGVATEAVGWKITGTEAGQGNVQLEFVQNGYFGMHAPSGGRMVDLGSSPGNTEISQSLTGLAIGQSYTLTFAMGSPDPASSRLEVYWNGQLIQNASVLVTSTMTAVTIDGLLPDANGNGVLTFREVGAVDYTGTYLADIGLAPHGAAALPLLSGSMDENGTVTINLGDHFSFGADGAGSVSVNPASVVITTPTGTVLGHPAVTVDPLTGQLHVDPGSSFDGLSQREIATITIPYTVTDQDGDSRTGLYQLTVNGTNDAPVITTTMAQSATVFENGDLDAVGANAAANGKFEPNVNIDGYLSSHLHSGIDMGVFLGQVQAQIGPQASLADAIATVWDYVDDNFSYYNNLLNEVSARLGVEYARYLSAGGKPLLDVVAKFVADGGDIGTNPDRLQSLHDNLLGNVHGASLIDKLLGAGQGSNPNPVPNVYNAIVSLLTAAGHPDLSGLLARPIYDGQESSTNLSLAWDQAHGLVPVASGQLAASDVDTGAVLGWSGNATTTYGNFAIDAATGKWTYTLNQSAASNGLGEGEKVIETFTATVTDEHGATDTVPVTITIIGANDAPVITVGDVAQVDLNESDAGLQASGTLSVLDVDVKDVVTAAVTATATGLGTHFTNDQLNAFFSIGPTTVIDNTNTTGDINWHFNSSGEAFNFLAAGETATIKYTIQVSDEHGGTDSQIIEINLIGTNDRPVVDLNGTDAGNTGSATAVEQLPQYILNSTALTAATISDVDSPQMNSMTVKFVGRPDGANEVLSLNPSGQAAAAGLAVTYDAASGVLKIAGAASTATYQTILQGVSYVNNSDTPATTGHSVEVIVNDGHDNSTAQIIDIKVIPLNDAPVLGGSLHGTVAENGTLALTATQLGYTDPDNLASEVVFRVTSLNGGEVRNNGVAASSFTAAELAAGKITFVHNGSAANSAGFNVEVEDGNQDGSTAVPKPFVIDVTHANIAPTVLETASAARYAFADDALVGASSQPKNIALDVTTLFAGSGLTYSVEEVYSTGGKSWSWMHSANSTSFSGNPGDNTGGLYVAKVTATNSEGSAVTYVAFHVLGDHPGDSTYANVTNGNAIPQAWLDNLITVDPAADFTAQVSGGDNGYDVLVGNGFANNLNGGSSDDMLLGGAGNDTLYGGTGHDYVSGGGGLDTLYAGTDGDWLDGGEGNDTLNGSSVADILIGGAGDDTIYGNGGLDWMDGGSDNDTLYGGTIKDVMLGGAGDDKLYGYGGDDVLNGGAGNDLLVGGDGSDTLTGGAGADRFVPNSAYQGVDTITDYVIGQGDTIDLSDLLNGANVDNSNIQNFVRLVDGANGSTSVQVNANGDGHDWNFVTAVNLSNGATSISTVIDTDPNYTINHI